MIARVRGKWLFRSFVLACSSAAILLSPRDGQAASSPTTEETTSRVVAIKVELVALQQPSDPELPPLGDVSKYIPPAELYPSMTTPTNTYLVIRLSDRRVYVYQNNQVQNSYPIAIGKDGWETPTGSFQVINKVRDPEWEHPWTGEIVAAGPDNPLGTRWIGFWTDGTNYIGFHGTPDEETVGQAASHGCIRMLNKDVVVLFEQVNEGTIVMVEP